MERFRACFADLVDARRGNAQRHELDEIVMVALLAMVSRAETCVDMALFDRSKEALLRRFLRQHGGIPSHDTFARVFRLLDPAAFEVCLGHYVAALPERIACSGNGGVVAVDGKTARRSFDRKGGQGPLHLISAFACDTQLALGQRKVDGKSNEITALPELLALLTLDGCSLVGCGGPHSPACVLAVKGNQKTLFEDIQLLLDDPDAAPAQTRARPVPRPERQRPRESRPIAPLGSQYSPRQPGKGSTRSKIKRAAWDDAFLLKLLAAG